MDLQTFSQLLLKQSFPLPFPGHWIGSKWRTYSQSTKLKESLSPNNGAELIYPSTDRQAIFDALDSAESYSQRPEKPSLDERLEALNSLRKALVDYADAAITMMRVEAGKPLWEAQEDFDFAVRFLDDFCKTGSKHEEALLAPVRLSSPKASYRLTPVGTTVAFMPFSTPFTSFVQFIAAAAFTNSPLILCPSSHAIFSGLLFSFLAEKIEMPEGLFSVVYGNFDSFKKALTDRRVQAIIYTGSREHCELIRRESKTVRGRQLILQSGGKNSILVHSSADIKRAVEVTMVGAFKATGQLCTATSRVFCHRSVYKEYVDALMNEVHDLKIGMTDKAGSDNVRLGPLYSKKAVEKFLRYQTMAHREAAKDYQMGRRIETEGRDACMVTPGLHLMREYDPKSAYQSNVLFCPDIALYEYEVLETAIDMINQTDSPYVVAAVGDESFLAPRLSGLTAPNITLNRPTTDVEYFPCIAGKVLSGSHRYNGAALAALLSYPQMVLSSP